MKVFWSILLGLLVLGSALTGCGHNVAGSDQLLQDAVIELKSGHKKEFEEKLNASIRSISQDDAAQRTWVEKAAGYVEELRKEGKATEAKELLEYDIALTDNLWGKYDIVTKGLREKLIVACGDMQDWSGAEAALDEILKDPEKQGDSGDLGSESDLTKARRIIRTGEYFENHDQIEGAERLYRRGLTLLEERMKGASKSTNGTDILGLWAIARAQADLGTLLSRGAEKPDGDELLKAASASAKDAKAAEAAATKESAPEMLLRDEMGFSKDKARVEKLLGTAAK